MNRTHVACFLLAVLTLTAGPRPAVSASSIDHDAAGVEILVGNTPQPRYAHEGRWYVEAHRGREYAIRLRNPYPVRVAVALSVDGLNTIDARETTAATARKWVLGPYQTVTISGWQTSSSDARRFEFTTEAGSYGEALGKSANLGVISAVFFRERLAAIDVQPTDNFRSRRTPAQPSAPAAQDARGSGGAGSGIAEKAVEDDYAATGMGRRTDHRVTQVWMDLEETPAQTVNIRYEFRAGLVRLGILPAEHSNDPLDRRERARGFEPGFSPLPRVQH